MINKNYLKNIESIKLNCIKFHIKSELNDKEFYNLHREVSLFLLSIDPACYEQIIDNYIHYTLNMAISDKIPLDIKNFIINIKIIKAYLERIGINIDDKKLKNLINSLVSKDNDERLENIKKETPADIIKIDEIKKVGDIFG